MSIPLFPGGVAVSDLEVYDWAGADGLCGGSPHLHTASSEGYIVTAGAGEVHTLTRDGAAVTPLGAGEVVWFSPGTVHRLVNHGQLRLLVVMQNAGLPEAGDAVLTFPDEVIDDPEAYAAAASLPSGPPEVVDAAARARRDLALEGYMRLRERIRARGPVALQEFQQRAATLVQPRVAQWQTLWGATVSDETERTRAQLTALADGDPGLMHEARIARAELAQPQRRWGMCGRLRTWAWPTP